MKTKLEKRYIASIILLAMLGVSLFYCKIASSPEHHKESIQVLDEKRETVLKIAASATAASAALSAIPGDAATGIANKLADIAFYGMIILAAIYLEKYLLVLTGLAAFKFLIPAACLIGIGGFLAKRKSMKTLALRIGLFAIAIMIILDCVFPILILWLFMWMIKNLLSINIEIPSGNKHRLDKEIEIE